MTENLAPCPPRWPPQRHKRHSSSHQPGFEVPTLTPATPTASQKEPSHPPDGKKPRKQYRNGYEVSPKTPSFVPYALEKKGRKRAKPFSFENEPPTKHPRRVTKILEERWNELAREAGVLAPDAVLREFQTQCASRILAQGGDVCVVAPTGAGKSMLWCLPVLAQPGTVSLVITPYTSLGNQGESDMNTCGLPAIFINADQNSEADLRQVARGAYRIVFICVESVETPRFAQVLHSKNFQAALQGIYLDEAHLVKESLDWRPGYKRLGQLRRVIGKKIPLVAISATLPSSYRRALCVHAGLDESYLLINLGNFRAELSLVVRPLQYPGSFQDLAFTLPTGASQSSIPSTIVYLDDIPKLTDMLWWYHRRLESMNLPTSLAGIVHSGLSEIHQTRAFMEFRDGHTRILLATEKIGAGVHLPRVERVVQYLARNNLTLAKLDQRRGRGARTRGMTAVCFFFVEPELIDGNANDVADSTDPGILALVRADGCYQAVLDQWLENPKRPRPFTYDIATRYCCSYCHPQLSAVQEYEWVVVDPSARRHNTNLTLPSEKRDIVLTELKQLRLNAWRQEWRTKWRNFGPETLIADADLQTVAKVAPSILSIDDLRPLTHIPYWNDFAPWLLSAVQATVLKLNLSQHVVLEGESETLVVTESQTHSGGRVNAVVGGRRANPRKDMHPAEMLIDFTV